MLRCSCYPYIPNPTYDSRCFLEPRTPNKLTICLPGEGAVQRLMPELTRRRYPEARDESWHVYYGDVHAGTLAKRTGNPHDTDPWEWRCGFYPGSHPGECRSGTAASLDEARGGFEEAWKVFLAARTEADFQEWRDQRDCTARKYALWGAGKRLEPPSYGPGKPCSKYVRLRRGLRQARACGVRAARAAPQPAQASKASWLSPG